MNENILEVIKESILKTNFQFFTQKNFRIHQVKTSTIFFLKKTISKGLFLKSNL